METRIEATQVRAERRTLAIEGFDVPGPDVWEFLLILVARKRLIGWLALTGALLAAGMALQKRDMYTATAVIMLPQQQRSTLASLVGQLSPVASAVGGGNDLRGVEGGGERGQAWRAGVVGLRGGLTGVQGVVVGTAAAFA